MSIAKWFVVRKPIPGEIIATSANQIMQPIRLCSHSDYAAKIQLRYKDVVLYLPDPLSSFGVLKGGRGTGVSFIL